MLVKEVLAENAGQIVYVPHSMSLADIAPIFIKHEISSVIVTNDDDVIVGLVTEHSFIRAICDRSQDGLVMPALQVVTSPVARCAADSPICDAVRTMTDHRTRHLLVEDDGRPAGVVSMDDLVTRLATRSELESRVLADLAMHAMDAYRTIFYMTEILRAGPPDDFGRRGGRNEFAQ